MTISYTPWRKWRRFTWRLQWWSMLTEGPGQWLLVAALWATLHSAVATWYQIILCICTTPSSYAIVHTENTSTLIMACKTQLRHKTQIFMWNLLFLMMRLQIKDGCLSKFCIYWVEASVSQLPLQSASVNVTTYQEHVLLFLCFGPAIKCSKMLFIHNTLHTNVPGIG